MNAYFIQTISDQAIISSKSIGVWIEAVSELEALQIYYERLEPLFDTPAEHFEYLASEMPTVTKVVKLEYVDDEYIYGNDEEVAVYTSAINSATN